MKSGTLVPLTWQKEESAECSQLSGARQQLQHGSSPLMKCLKTIPALNSMWSNAVVPNHRAMDRCQSVSQLLQVLRRNVCSVLNVRGTLSLSVPHVHRTIYTLHMLRGAEHVTSTPPPPTAVNPERLGTTYIKDSTEEN